MAGFRFSLATYNLWATARWPEREPALRKFAQEIAPEILAVQELRPETQALLDEELKGHGRIADPFDGWTREGNIYWDTGLFDLEDYGAEDVGIFPARAFPLAAERKSRRLEIPGHSRSLLYPSWHHPRSTSPNTLLRTHK